MDTPVIHAHSFSDKSTVPYVVMMWETMRLLANRPEALRLTVHCIGPTAAGRLKSLPNTSTYHVFDAEVGAGSQGGSSTHAVCTEHALALTDDGDIHITVDSDTVMLARGWDDYIRCELLDRGTGTCGATYEDIGGFSSGNGTHQSYKGIPDVVWMAMSPAHRWRDLKVAPNKSNVINITNEGQAKIYNLPVGYQLVCDVGWQIPEYLHSRNISYVGWKQLKGSGTATIIKGLGDYHEEFHVDGDVPFVAHQRGSLRHAYRNGGISTGFYTAIDKWLAVEKDHEPRWTWQPNDVNAPALASMKQLALESKDRIADIEKRYSDPLPEVALPVPSLTPIVIDTMTAASTDGNLQGWLKATLDGPGIVWSRYAPAVPKQVTLTFTPDATMRGLRLEGTVTGGLTINVPPAPMRTHTMTVRNLTPGSITLQASGRGVVNVPSNTCWLVLIDGNDVIHVE
jgi:hypothetical protein